MVMHVLGITGDKIPAFRYEHLVNNTGGGPESPHSEYLGANHSIKVQPFFSHKIRFETSFKTSFYLFSKFYWQSSNSEAT